MKIMGILNVTPDSFSDGGRFSSTVEAVEAGLAMFDAGATIIDVGGESSRPGATAVSLCEERRRALPVVRALAKHGAVSIDTRKIELAREAVNNGAAIINDTTGTMGPLAGSLGVGYVGMHCEGTPATMQHVPHYDDVVAEVWGALGVIAREADRSGARQVWIDPGIGFGKTTAQNVALLKSLPAGCDGDWRVLIGVSRKSVIGALTGRHQPAERLAGSLAAAAAAWSAGVDIIRTHDVSATVDLLAVLEAVSGHDTRSADERARPSAYQRSRS
jgi:dihydropteroate synthase